MQRQAHGSTLIEMLVTTVIMSILALAFMSVLLVNFKTNAKVTTLEDNVNAIRTIKERIGRDVRMGRSLGDVYGTSAYDGASGITYFTGSDKFPANNDPVYGSTPPSTPSGWTSPPWQLSNTCLIVQVPIGDDHNDSVTTHARNAANQGWPTMINTGQGNPAATSGVDNVETHVYMVLKDPNNPTTQIPDPANPKSFITQNQYVLQYASFGGYPVTGYNKSAHTFGPETLITGIIGPLDSSGNPKVFQFVKKNDSSGTPVDSIQPDGTHAAEYTGVIVNLEVRRHQDSTTKRTDISINPIGMKLEVFLRNNALATSCNSHGVPASLGP